MVTLRRVWIAAAASSLGVIAVAQAHHSFSAVFDGTKPVTLVGTVTKFEFINPHGWVSVDVAGAAGVPAGEWRVEVANPNALIRLGWRKDSLKPGDKVTIEGFRSHDGSNTAFGKDFKLAKKDIESRKKDPKSLMPENLLGTMTEEDLLDIVEYLLTLKQEVKK